MKSQFDKFEFLIDMGRAVCFILITIAIAQKGFGYDSPQFWVIEACAIALWTLGKIDNN